MRSPTTPSNDAVNVLLLGATGAVGRRVAGELSRSDAVHRLVVSSRNGTTLERFAHNLGGAERGVFPLEMDVSKEDSLAVAGREFDVIASCVGPSYLYEEIVVSAAVAAGTACVSLGDDAATLQRLGESSDSAAAAGATIVTGCGLSPGLTNLMGRLAAAQLDEVDKIAIHVARSASDAGGPASLRSLVRTVAEGPPPPSRGPEDPNSATPRPSFFPDPVGWVETFGYDHPELATLRRSFPGVRSVEFRAGLAERAAMDLVRAVAAVSRTEGSGGRSIAAAGLLRRVLERLPARSAEWTAARVDVEGRREGRPLSISYGIVDHLANLAALPMAQAALALGSGDTAAPGVHAPDEVFGAKPFLRALSHRGLRIARLEPHAV